MSEGMFDAELVAELMIALSKLTAENERLREACEPLLIALKDKAPFHEDNWNPEYHLEITASVAEARKLAQALKGEE